MKTFGININGWFIAMFMFLTGKDSWNLPNNTCNLFWQSARMFVLLPITLLGAILIKLVDMSEDGDGNLWGRIGMSFAVVLGYIMLLMIGDSFVGSIILDLPDKEMALSHLGWFAYVYLPIIGTLIVAIPLTLLAAIGTGLYHTSKYIKKEYQEVAETHFGIEIDKETDLPKNKFWAILYMIHNKTCAKINWER